MDLINTVIRLQPGNLVLIEDQLKITSGMRYGLIGANGTGKTTLLGWIWKFLKKQRLIRVGRIEQNIGDLTHSKVSVLDHLIKQDSYRNDLLKQKSEIEKMLYEEDDDEEDDDEEDDEIDVELWAQKLSQIEDDLIEIKSNSATKRAKIILSGLGFDTMVEVSTLSGGWIMRLQLATLLYLKLDLMLLDEPTNHLDIDAVEWLEDYLSSLGKSKTLILVSHDYRLLKQTCNRFLRINDKKLILSKTLEFGGKIKQITKHLFDFNDDIKYGNFNIQLHDVGFGYHKSPLFSDIDLFVDTKTRIGILGPNGIGKSTLLKLISGELKPKTGEIRVSRKLRLSRLQQIFNFEEEISPIEYIKKYKNMKVQQIRAILGKSGLTGKVHTLKISSLSGGQKSRLMIAKILTEQPHVILLDEPSNHLDFEGVQVLIDALKNFNGGFIVVSHDRHFVYETCKVVYELKDCKLNHRS